MVKQGDATKSSELAPLFAGHDTVVSASRFQTSDAASLIGALKQACIKRLPAVGEAGGRFCVGGDELLVDATGRSWISMEDFAIAFVDELEHPKHSRRRFTVGY